MDYHEFDPRPEDVAGGYQTHSFLPSFPSGQADAGMDQGGLFMEQPIERMEEEEEDEVLLIGSNLATHRAPPRHKRAKMIQDEEEVNIVDTSKLAELHHGQLALTNLPLSTPMGTWATFRSLGALVINKTSISIINKAHPCQGNRSNPGTPGSAQPCKAGNDIQLWRFRLVAKKILNYNGEGRHKEPITMEYCCPSHTPPSV